MKINEMRGKDVVIKCTSKEEMIKVVDVIDKYIPWAFRGAFFSLIAFDNGYVFIFVEKSGSYNNERGNKLTHIEIKILASDFLKNNSPTTISN